MPPTGTIVKIKQRRQERQVGRQLEHDAVGLGRHEVFFEEELDAVGERLQDAEGTRPVRPDAVLHVGDDLALEPDHQHDRDEEHDEGDDDLHDGDDEDAEVDALRRRGDRPLRQRLHSYVR